MQILEHIHLSASEKATSLQKSLFLYPILRGSNTPLKSHRINRTRRRSRKRRFQSCARI